MRIAIDLDGVCYDFTSAFRETVKRYHPGKRTEHLDAMRWEFYKDWGFTTPQFLDLCKWGIKDRTIFGKGTPFPGTKQALDSLRDKGHKIIFVTDRANLDPEQSGVIKNATRAWLERYSLVQQQYVTDELWFEGDKTKVVWDVLLDDKIENYDAAVAAGRDCWLFDRPYNQDPPGMEGGPRNRVKTWFEFLQRVDERQHIIDLKISPLVTTGEVRKVSSTGGQKGEKLARFDLIPARPMWKVAEVYGIGARKYEDRNWEKGYEWGLSIGAAERHLSLFKQGESIDKQDGQHHLASLVFHALALMEFEDTHPEFDNRGRRSRD